MKLQNEKAEITHRVSACRCGCKGQDSWHARHFNRTLRNVTIETGEIEPTWIDSKFLYTRTADVQLPFGKCKAYFLIDYVKGHGNYKMGWGISKESRSEAINKL